MRGISGYRGWRLAVALVAVGAGSLSCTPNSPYPASESGKNILYSEFSEPPSFLDPALSYSEDEYIFLGHIYEAPFQYHFLKRPYVLEPLTAEKVPEPLYLDKAGNPLPASAPPEKVARVVYEIRIKKGIRYQNHPCFVKKTWTPEELAGIRDVRDIRETATRELVAADYVHQIKRMADPHLLRPCPILSVMAKYIEGMEEYAAALDKSLETERAGRKARDGAAYNQEFDERENPILLDLNANPLPGVVEVDRYTYRIILKQPYPQILYWLAMPFFSPVPPEAVAFYNHPTLMDQNVNLNRFPVGTGPYRMEKFDPNAEIVLVRNENYHPDPYPSEGDPGDAGAGLLADAGKPMPFIDKIVFKREKESIPIWYKFLQGYYDTSGIPAESFDQSIRFSSGGAELTDDLRNRGVRLVTSVRPTEAYYFFNMADDVVGGYTPGKQKIRQAISIALDIEESIQIFRNGRGIPAQGPIPPGIFGYEEGVAGININVYNWDEKAGRAVRKPVEEAKKLLAEAGFPGGKDKEGRPLVIRYAEYTLGGNDPSFVIWLRKQLQKIGVELEVDTTDYNRFQEKIRKGSFQLAGWGWNADYPDPENFLFLLYGPNGKIKFGGENVANYDSPDFNALFKKVECMTNGPERMALIRQMVWIVRRDSPWVWGFHPMTYVLSHEWYKNVKSNAMSHNSLKFKRVDAALRERRRMEWNRPVWWPVALVAGILILGSIPAAIVVRRREKGAA
ncbi:MAG: ABC transporter substrate-binding protein [Planctomycetota bacterium]